MTELKKVLMKRDGMSSDEADLAINNAKTLLTEYMMANDFVAIDSIMMDEFGLEQDYFFDLVD